MTENDYQKICDLFQELHNIKQYQEQLLNTADSPIEVLLNLVSGSIHQYQGELAGEMMKYERPIDKLFYENRERIKKVIVDILNEEEDRIIHEKRELKTEIKNIKVGFNEK